jgi:beta-glucosidase
MVNELQKGALSTRLGIPMIYGIDAVHGHNNVYKATIFPHNVGLGATRQVKIIPHSY